ncbi:hypothetical protein BZA05DRAFT_442802 [Tricharina praecox]|uniref:uncharacterized protein n=1 Tax=Tricharina praecox TaxID=43433 RepID=UPI00221F2BDF|nr:uncharacterized protein BZA05DRAFT_442802 [Tricharina praecox]KAI5855143.1 hypothetical protein BZA05DRAFT_442802 [Tricharina praecox]
MDTRLASRTSTPKHPNPASTKSSSETQSTQEPPNIPSYAQASKDYKRRGDPNDFSRRNALIDIATFTGITETDLMKILFDRFPIDFLETFGHQGNWLTGLLFDVQRERGRTYTDEIGRWLKEWLARLRVYTYHPRWPGILVNREELQRENARLEQRRLATLAATTQNKVNIGDESSKDELPANVGNQEVWHVKRADPRVRSIYHNWYNSAKWSPPARGMGLDLDPTLIVDIHLFGGRGDHEPKDYGGQRVHCGACNAVFTDLQTWFKHAEAYRGWVQCPWEFVEGKHNCGPKVQRYRKFAVPPPLPRLYNDWEEFINHIHEMHPTIPIRWPNWHPTVAAAWWRHVQPGPYLHMNIILRDERKPTDTLPEGSEFRLQEDHICIQHHLRPENFETPEGCKPKLHKNTNTPNGYVGFASPADGDININRLVDIGTIHAKGESSGDSEGSADTATDTAATRIHR